MAGVRHMQGVPAHLTTLKGDGKRRDKRRCIFYDKDDKSCTCAQNLNYYNCTCGGSSKCEHYEEKEKPRK